jgi:hypothetical protein
MNKAYSFQCEHSLVHRGTTHTLLCFHQTICANDAVAQPTSLDYEHWTLIEDKSSTRERLCSFLLFAAHKLSTCFMWFTQEPAHLGRPRERKKRQDRTLSDLSAGGPARPVRGDQENEHKHGKSAEKYFNE